MSIEAMKQAIEALNGAVAFREGGRQKAIDAINALRTAIQQAESEPVAWPLRAQVWKRESTQEWVLEIAGTLGDTDMNIRHTQPLSVAYENVPGLPTFYTPPAPGVPDDVARNAERYLWLRSARKNGGSRGPYDERLRTMLHKDGTGRTMFQFYFWCRPEQLDSSIDAAMLAASPAQKGGE